MYETRGHFGPHFDEFNSYAHSQVFCCDLLVFDVLFVAKTAMFRKFRWSPGFCI